MGLGDETKEAGMAKGKTEQGTHTFADGTKYVGEYRDGTRHGQGTYTFADGRVEKGTWVNGEFLG
tara:strand:- start:316 stop:510 length:195 start_codon:yes stop_codon:yes gene_type:complete